MNDDGYNVRSPRYFIARTRRRCWHCGESTDLVALALPPGHETLTLDEDAEHESDSDAWQVSSGFALLFHIEFLAPPVATRLKSMSRSFRVDDVSERPAEYSFDKPWLPGESGANAWANHCESCGSTLDDQELFCEPGGAFSPSSEHAADRIELTAVDEAFAAGVSGYDLDPYFFHAVRRR